MDILYLDLLPTYIPFIKQIAGSTGVIDPSVDNLIIYEEDGGDASWSSSQISGSPFDPGKVNGKTGFWGVLVPKSVFTAGKCYIALWEFTVSGVTTAKSELFLAANFNTLEIANSELSSIPTTTSSLRLMLQYVFQYLRNKKTVTSNTETMLKEDASTPLGTSALSDDGSIFTRGEMN